MSVPCLAYTPAGPPSATPSAAPAQACVTIAVGSPRDAPPTLRFVIRGERPDVAELYQPNWVLGLAAGNERLDSGVDLRFPDDVTIPPAGLVRVGLGVSIRALQLSWPWPVPGAPVPMPVGVPTAYSLVPRSSIARPSPPRVLLMPNAPGTIDVGYTGELAVQLYNPTAAPVSLRRGDSVVQAVGPVLQPAEYSFCLPGDPTALAVFGPTERGGAGFGSTGAAGAGAASPPADALVTSGVGGLALGAN